MDINSILVELRAERDRIDQAISVLEAVNSSGHPQRSVVRRRRATVTRSRRSRMSAAARRKLSQLLKQRWAQGKMKPKAKAAPPSKPARRMSAAGRKRIIEATKRRWAAWRKKQGKAA